MKFKFLIKVSSLIMILLSQNSWGIAPEVQQKFNIKEVSIPDNSDNLIPGPTAVNPHAPCTQQGRPLSGRVKASDGFDYVCKDGKIKSIGESGSGDHSSTDDLDFDFGFFFTPTFSQNTKSTKTFYDLYIQIYESDVLSDERLRQIESRIWEYQKLHSISINNVYTKEL